MDARGFVHQQYVHVSTHRIKNVALECTRLFIVRPAKRSSAKRAIKMRRVCSERIGHEFGNVPVSRMHGSGSGSPRLGREVEQHVLAIRALLGLVCDVEGLFCGGKQLQD